MIHVTDVDMYVIIKIMMEHALAPYALLNQCVAKHVKNGHCGVMITISEKHNCEGCNYFTHHRCGFYNHNIASNICPCSLCIIKMMCKSSCPDWFEWKIQKQWL